MAGAALLVKVMTTAFQHNNPQHGDALALLQSLSDSCTRLVFFDPQHRDNLNKLKYGNEGARQQQRCLLPQMSADYIEQCCRKSARVLMPSGYLMLWQNAFGVCEGWHQQLADAREVTNGGDVPEPSTLAADCSPSTSASGRGQPPFPNHVLKCVDLVAWDNQRLGMGYRARRRGDYVVVLQKLPLKARATWRSSPTIPDRWPEKVNRKLHPHIKPVGLISALIEATTSPGDLVVDPAAGSFVVMHGARQLGRDFIGCDLAYAVSDQAAFDLDPPDHNPDAAREGKRPGVSP